MTSLGLEKTADSSGHIFGSTKKEKKREQNNFGGLNFCLFFSVYNY